MHAIASLHAHVTIMCSYCSLVPRPPPRFYLTTVEKNRDFLHGCEIKSERRPGNEAIATDFTFYSMLVVFCTCGGHVLIYEVFLLQLILNLVDQVSFAEVCQLIVG